MKYVLLLLLSLVSARPFAAVQVPGSDIWLAALQSAPGVANELKLSAPRNLTARPGYDNQPAFVSNDALLFASMDEQGQTDAWRFDLGSGDAAPVRRTAESEYSPTPAPGSAISVVRVALDGVQQLWMLPSGAAEYQLQFPMLEGVGYHAWLDDTNVALFMIRGEGEPVELHIANRDTGDVTVMAKGIGRCLQPMPDRAGSLAFIEDGDDGERWIKRLDFDERRIVRLAPVLEGSEDFAFLPNGSVLMAQGKAVYVYRDQAWQLVARFDALPGDISRLAVSPDGRQVAMVVAES